MNFMQHASLRDFLTNCMDFAKNSYKTLNKEGAIYTEYGIKFRK